MHDPASRDHRPWPLVFSFSRAIQQPALDRWCGSQANVAAAQAIVAHRAQCNRAALHGEYHEFA
jgi:fructose-bisphosphate aldolase class I